MILSPDLFSLRPTQHGVLFVFILGAMLAGAVNYNNNAGFVLVFLLGGMALISFVYSFRNMRGMGVYFLTPRPVFAGDELAFPVRIKAGDRDRNAIGLGSAGARLVFLNLARGGEDVVELRMPTEKRGRVTLASVAIFSVFPLGLFRIRLRVRPGVEAVVYPRQIPGELAWGGGEAVSGEDNREEQPGNGAGNGQTGVDDFQGLEPWQPGQPRGRIAWKAYSGGRGLLIKDFSSGRGENLVLDYEELTGGDREFRLSRLCHMAVTAHGQGRTFGLHLPGQEIPPPGWDTDPTGHLETCLRALALFKGEKS